MANKGQQSNSYKKETKEEIVRKYMGGGFNIMFATFVAVGRICKC